MGGFTIFVEGFAVQTTAAQVYSDQENQMGFRQWGLAGNVLFTEHPGVSDTVENIPAH
jgi:hypothetical protein